MKTNTKILLTTFALAGALSLALTTGDAQTAPAAPKGKGKEGKEKLEHHPVIHRAIAELEEAKKHLEHADHDFGGHRKQALIDCDKALVQLRLALQFDKK